VIRGRLHPDGTLISLEPRDEAARSRGDIRALFGDAPARLEAALRKAASDGHAQVRAPLAGGNAELSWQLQARGDDTVTLEVRPIALPDTLMRQICEEAASGLALSDRDGILRYVNTAYATVFGRTPDELVGTAFTELLQPADRPWAWDQHRALVDGSPCAQLVEYVIRRPDGEQRIIHVDHKLIDIDGEPARLSSVVDATENRRTERQLSEAEAQLRDLMDTIPGAIFRFRHTPGEGYSIDHVSEGLRAIAGLDDETDLRDFGNWQRWVPEPEREAYLESIERSRQRLTDWSHEWPVHVPAGRLWLRGVSRPRREADGSLVWNGLVFDITDRKAAEERLGHVETDYRHVFDHTREGLYRSAPDGRLLDVNWPLVQMHRCASKDELIESVGDLARDWYVDAGARARFLDHLARYGWVEDFEAEAYRIGTGEIFLASENARAVHDAEGNLLYYQGSVRDVTEQHLLHRLAARRGEILEMIARGAPLSRVVHEIVATIEGYQPHLSAAVCQIYDDVLDVEAAPALAPPCVEAFQHRGLRELDGCIAAAIDRLAPVLESEVRAAARSPSAIWRCMRASGYSEAIALPVLDQTGGPLGVLAVFAAESHSIDDKTRMLLHEMAQIASIAFDQHGLMQKLVQQAQYDPLTDLPNRTLLQDRLRQLLLDAQRHGHTVATLMLDLDDFKLVNDTLGHAAGDRLLHKVAGRLLECVRGGDTVARFGGDEFVLAVPLKSAGDATALAERILARLHPAIHIDEQELLVRTSIGISIYPQDGETPDQLIQAADTAMYSAKQAGRNQFRYFAESMNQRFAGRLRIERQLRAALERNELALFYQPRVALDGREIYGAEVLLRWQHPERGLLGPGEFLPIAEQSSLIGEIDRYVLEHATREVARWQQAGHELVISINVSARLLDQADFGALVARLVHESGARPAGLELEITEGILMQDFEHATQQLEALKQQAPGLRLALDDFGSGYSSLQYLRQLPIDTLKIDRTFVADLDHPVLGATGRAIVKTIVELGHSLGMQVVAEGVETAAQIEALMEIGCDDAQGFWFSPAVEGASFVTRVGMDRCADRFRDC
jgi:diguanylate cyclase (GGDEF)-like protein/PAS domain S-box-containing protein